jgi:cytochrome oxidase assembly protein ShyY1
MNRPQHKGLRFDPEWRITLFVVLLVPLMVGLGFWQLERAEEKARLQLEFQRQRSLLPAALEQLADETPAGLAYRPVMLRGEYLAGRDFLLDNRVYQGRYGFEVITPLRLAADGSLALVNRGWIAGDPARRSVPDVPVVAGPVAVTGHVYVPPGEPYILAEQEPDGSWPRVVQTVKVGVFAGQVDGAAPVFPYLVRLDAGQAGALEIDWQIINVSPEKHTGYAVQWFTMAAVLSLFYLFHSSNLGERLFGRKEKTGR